MSNCDNAAITSENFAVIQKRFIKQFFKRKRKMKFVIACRKARNFLLNILFMFATGTYVLEYVIATLVRVLEHLWCFPQGLFNYSCREMSK